MAGLFIKWNKSFLKASVKKKIPLKKGPTFEKKKIIII